MNRVVIGLDCGEMFLLSEGAQYNAICDRVEIAHTSDDSMMDFVSDRGRIHVNVECINYILEESE